MEISGRHTVVTGAASGIGRALAVALAAEGAVVVVADRELEAARVVAEELGGLAIGFDAGAESSMRTLINDAIDANGPIDIFISNAGVPGASGGPEAADDVWDETWRVNVMAHVWASRMLLPGMLERGEGYLINTASAAGLLIQLSSLTYSVTKHAAVSLAEWLAIAYGDKGIRVSCICPQGVRTPMLEQAMSEPAGAAALRQGGLIEPEDVAEVTVAGIRDERFLILPHQHEQVAKQLALKGWNLERWLENVRGFAREAREADDAGDAGEAS